MDEHDPTQPSGELSAPAGTRLDAGRVAELEAAIQARDQLVSVLGHQLRNALAPLVLLATQFDDGSDRRFALLTKHLSTLTATIDRISELSQLRDGALVLEPSLVDLGQVITEVIEELAREAKAGGAELRVTAPPSVTGHWDRARLRQILVAIVHNAVRYGGAGVIEIVVDAADDRVRVSVQDSGPGIAEPRRAHLFEAFDRVGERRRGSLGVGLWVARTLARAMRGDLVLETSERPGARFCLTLRRE